MAATAVNQIGTRTRKKPRFTTTGFLRASRSTTLAVSSCGANHDPWAIIAATPMASWLSVSWLMNRGTTVAEEIKLAPNQKFTPSSRLTVKFQR